jgi:hypothetical protein
MAAHIRSLRAEVSCLTVKLHLLLASKKMDRRRCRLASFGQRTAHAPCPDDRHS